MKKADKISMVLLGLVLGLDIGGFMGNLSKSIAGTEKLIIALAVIVIIFEFFDGQLSRQVCRLIAATIVGVTLCEYLQLAVEICLIISMIAILIAAEIIILKNIIQSKEKTKIFSKIDGSTRKNRFASAKKKFMNKKKNSQVIYNSRVDDSVKCEPAEEEIISEEKSGNDGEQTPANPKMAR